MRILFVNVLINCRQQIFLRIAGVLPEHNAGQIVCLMYSHLYFTTLHHHSYQLFLWWHSTGKEFLACHTNS
jgi:hypothetical protein